MTDNIVLDTPLPPLRGLITLHDAAGEVRHPTTLRKWIRLSRTVFKTVKADLLTRSIDAGTWELLAPFADAERMRLSLRVPVSCPINSVMPLRDSGLHDIFLQTPANAYKQWAGWMEKPVSAGVPVRVRVAGNWRFPLDVKEAVAALEGAACVTVAPFDPFFASPPASDPDASRQAMHHIQAFVRALAEQGVDVCLTELPFCLTAPDLLPCAFNMPQCFADHAFYEKQGFEFARLTFRFGTHRVDKAVENLLARRTSVHNAIDAALFPWILDYPRPYIRLWMYHKLTRHLWFGRRRHRPLPENLTALDQEVDRLKNEALKRMGPVCAACSMRLACDHHTPELREALPGIAVTAIGGTPVPAAPSETAHRPRYLDPLDRARLQTPDPIVQLAETTREILLHEAPTREISADSYAIRDRYTHHMPGAVRWLSFSKGECESTVLARVEPPFTLSLTVGGGIASHIGFSFGRHAKIVCPMVDYSHRITLGVDSVGNYALLRDGQYVRPAEFESARLVPDRLAGVLEPRISLHNIDGMILTQTVLLWEGGRHQPERMRDVKYSAIIISTRYSRRLQAALLALAHQQGTAPGLFEVVIGYVPGIDGTDDLIESMRLTFPQMRIVRSPFAEANTRSKGFMINESLRAASGKWVLLMDADIVLPPDTFVRLESMAPGAHFIAPEGRKMLTAEQTGQILLGEIRPWECYQQLLQGPGEIRAREADGIPIGFFQCVRREILARIPYHELDHFESSDWVFGRDATHHYGKEIRIKDFHVLHLDHGGSQWYGTARHR